MYYLIVCRKLNDGLHCIYSDFDEKKHQIFSRAHHLIKNTDAILWKDYTKDVDDYLDDLVDRDSFDKGGNYLMYVLDKDSNFLGAVNHMGVIRKATTEEKNIIIFNFNPINMSTEKDLGNIKSAAKVLIPNTDYIWLDEDSI